MKQCSTCAHWIAITSGCSLIRGFKTFATDGSECRGWKEKEKEQET